MSFQIQPLGLAAPLLLAGLFSSECRAAPPTRDGLYLQLSTGIGLPHFSITADDQLTTTKHYADSESDRSFNGSLFVGWQLRPGFALDVGSLWRLYAPNPRPTENGQPYGQVTDITPNPFDHGLSGIGLMAGVGHDWWISEHCHGAQGVTS